MALITSEVAIRRVPLYHVVFGPSVIPLLSRISSYRQMPLRMVCSCGDAAVRLISPGSGECVTSLLIPDLVPVVDVVYAAGEGWSPFTAFCPSLSLKNFNIHTETSAALAEL